MSPNDDDKHYRSVKLCQLVYDRKVDSKIGFEIRKLMEEGVLIDFQDLNRNHKTAIHVAVDKRDVICVKFLLQFKPSLEVKDGDGKTAVELADMKGYQRVLAALLSSTFDVVNESFVEVIDFESLTRQKIEAIKSRPTFKVLKLTNCPNTIKKVWKRLNDHGYTKILNESSHLFFIAIETKKINIRNDAKLMKKVLNLRRPMIVQVTSASSQNTEIHFKDDKKDFVEITDIPQITWEEFNEAVKSNDVCNMKLLVAALRSNLFGNFTGDLIGTKLSTNEDRSEAVNQFVKSNALCHRFFKLFDESQPPIERIVAALSFKGDQSLLALLDLPFARKEEKMKLTEYQQDILNVVDSSGCNLLMMAVELGNLDAVKLLLRCECDFNHSDNYDNRASDVCWEMKAFECLSEFIEAGSPYPTNFRIDELDQSSEAYKRINTLTEAINSFHVNIKQGDIEEVKKFVASHPHIKHAYDTKNKSALTMALQSKEIDIYSLLMSEGFEPGADYDEYHTALDNSKCKEEIRNSNRKYFKEAFDEPHLKRLVEKSKLSFGSKDRAKCSTIIRKMFDELNEIDEVIPILKICSLPDQLRIVFDFNCNSVVDMDPSNALGAVYPIGGFVYIGAKNHEKGFCEVIGTLIHELTHYAMKLTYENSCKPYRGVDNVNGNRFEEITKESKIICEEKSSTDSIVATVFTSYKPEVWHQELIVRVPQLLAPYKTNSIALEAAERNTPEMFHFYREKTLKDVERQSKVLLQAYLIGKINNQTGIARKIENMNIKFEKVEIDLKPSVHVITSNAPQLTLAMLSQAFPSSSHIFVTLEQVAIGNILNKIAKVKARESSTALIVDCIGQAQKYPENLGKLLKHIKNIKSVALVMTEAESSKVKENFPKFEVETFDHKWGELTESSKVHLLDQNVIFQGVEMHLNELVEPSSEAMNFFPLGSIVDCKDFKIGHESHQTLHKFYIPRKFIRKSQERLTQARENAKSFEELLQDEPGMGTMIISDEAGSGKSVTLSKIAKSLHGKFPDRWVLFVDLKRHIEAFKSVESYEKIETFEDFIAQNIFKNEPEFDRELFMEMFRAGKTFVLFDGFDEISPNYKDLLLHILNLFEPRSGNQLSITTRPHLEADLECALGKFVFKIEELSKEVQRQFLKDYWQSVGLEISHAHFEVLSQGLLDWFSYTFQTNLIGLPLLMRMTAEIFEDPIRENWLHKMGPLSIASLFQKFVEKYFARWTNNENEISRSETVEFVMAGGVLEVHHSIAINHIFYGEFTSFCVDESDAEKIIRVGLIRYDKTEKTFQFIHETFAEYFVADFISFHLNRKNRDPSHDCSKAAEVLIGILDSKDFKFRVIKSFLGQTLEAMQLSLNEAFCKSFAKCLSEMVKSQNLFDFLRRSLRESPENLNLFLLSIVKHVETEVLLKMLKSKGKDSSESTALLIAAEYGSVATVSTLCYIITTYTDKPKEIYQIKGQWGNVLFAAVNIWWNKKEGVLTALCENLNSVLTKNEVKAMLEQKRNGYNIIESADSSTDEVFLELISLLPKYFSRDEIKSLMSSGSVNHNFLQDVLMRNTKERLKLKIEFIKSYFNVEEQKSFFYKPKHHPNMFHCAAENRNEKIFETLIEDTRDVLSVDEIKSMLMEKDSYGSNVLHKIAEWGNANSLIGLNLLLRERLFDDEIRRLLLEVTSEGQNCFRLAANNDEIDFHVFCEAIGNLLSIEDRTRLLLQSNNEIDIIRLACGNNSNEILPLETIKQLLRRENYFGLNAFQKVASGRDVDKWNKLISFAQTRLSPDEMKSFLFSCDKNGENCLHQAITILSLDNVMVEAVCKTIKSVLSVEDQKNFVRQKDLKNRNVFQKARAKSAESAIVKLYDDLSTILSKEEIWEMLKEKDSNGDNILCFNEKSSSFPRSFPNRHEIVTADLLPFLQTVLTYDEVTILLFNVNLKGENFFQYAVKRSTNAEIKSLSKVIKRILSQNDQKKLFGIESRNIFHLAARNPNSGIFSATHECLKGVLTEKEIKSLIQEKDSENQNVLHLICRHKKKDDDLDNEKRLRNFLKVLKVVCNTDALKTFVISSDHNGNNCLLLAAQFQDQLFMRELFSFIQSELSIEDQRNLILKCGKNGNDIFKLASWNKKLEVYFVVENFAKEILSENQFKELKNKNWFVNYLWRKMNSFFRF